MNGVHFPAGYQFAWLGVSLDRQGHGLGRLLLVQALRDCHEAGKTFAFVAVILDCFSDAAKSFYQQWDFQEVPERPYRLFLSAHQLEAMMREPGRGLSSSTGFLAKTVELTTPNRGNPAINPPR